MGKVSKGQGCSVSGCSSNAVRSVSKETAAKAGLSTQGEGRRVYVCDTHYKALKKARRREERLERMRWGP